MSYYALVTKLHNFRKDPNSDKLYLADCYNEGVIVDGYSYEDQRVLYLPADGQIERWFGDQFNLFRKNRDGTKQGGYIEDNGHIRAIKLRGNQSAGIAISLDKIYDFFGDQHWIDGEKVNEINEKQFCCKYIPVQKNKRNGTTKTSYKGRKAEGITYPEFCMHADTEQLAYNLDQFKPGDIINLSLKMHGTSQRSMRTYGQVPKGFFRKLFHLPAKTKQVYVCGTRRCVVTENSKDYYGNDEFRMKHHKAFEPYIEDGMEIFYEVVGYYGPGETDTIMPIADNSKMNDKNFIKEFGKKTVFNYGCKPGESKAYVYRITSNNGEHDWSPQKIKTWCEERGILHVPYISTFEFQSKEDLLNRINTYFEDLHDPIGGHVKEGVVVRIINRPSGWKAFKSKTFEFKVLSNLVNETVDTSAMSPDIISEL